MASANRHRIQRQVIELDLDTSVRGPQLQEALARSFWERSVPELEAVFDRAAGPETLLRLDRLEIDLGVIQGSDWELQFRRKLIEQMTRSLAQASPVSAEGSEFPEDGDSRIAEPLRQFLYFLAHGRLPWWGGKPDKDWPEALLPSLDHAGWAAIHQLLRVNVDVGLRFIASVSDDFLATIAEDIVDLHDIPLVLAQLRPAGLSALDGRRWRADFWAILLDWLLTEVFPAGRGAELMHDLLRLKDGYQGSASQHEEPLKVQRGLLEADKQLETRGLSPLPQPWCAWLAAAQTKRDETEAESARRYPSQNQAEARFEPPSAAPESSAVGSSDYHRWSTPNDAQAINTSRSYAESLRCNAADKQPGPSVRDDEAIYLECAGAVIIHPFLEELFRGRGLLAQRDFRDSDARHQAVHLLGFLSYGREDIPEYELLPAKLLCGLPFQESLAAAELLDEDRAACDSLLRAVLSHWTALRSSSPDWLRAQFFLREGKLEPVEAGWRLTVERRAQDVLLGRLPWGLGVIGLPWLEQRIFVRWLE